ncbi:sugar phosphate isomerase/epimerase [Paenarthrobacter nicotinovorans]|uniref:sugar phosphate isomerase/epimerase family protein n=1 Tax=Paenarthrobacter nicotinovorans TaxID=29320 RepID=UPI0027864555|nr:sugar phosphate isomerase/epimerase [Paenarthrobacter nicotinovorans]MDP9933775.1 sugar phosphate isomerase/epimerase [Paenarthrobacter nicotinovorans]
MPYSLQLYSLRNAITEDLPGTIKKVAEIGYTQVEPYNFVALASDLGAALKENGLSAPSGHAPLLSQDQDQIFTAAKELGITTVIDPFLPAEHWQDAETIQATAAKLNAAAKKGAEYGIRVGYHNHNWELGSRISGVTALEYLVTFLDPEVVLEVDSYWAAVAGEDPVALVDRLGERVVALHVKDGPVEVIGSRFNPDEYPSIALTQLPAGQGAIDIMEVIEAAKNVEIKVVEFDDYAGDIFQGISESLYYLSAREEAQA